MSDLLQRFSRDILAIGWLCFSGLLGLCLFSYSPTDPSLHSVGNQLTVANYCGYFGSFTADLLYQLFGLSSWSLFFIGIRQSLANFRQDIKQWRVNQIVALGLLLLVVTSLLGLYFPQQRIFAGEIYVGGLIGHTMALSLTHILNFVGASLILWSSAAVLILFVTEKPLMFFLRQMLRPFEFIWQRIAESLRSFRSRFKPMENSVTEISQKEESAQSPSLLKKTVSLPLAGAASVLPSISLPTKKNSVFKKLTRPLSKRPRKVENWQLPKVSMLKDAPRSQAKIDEKEIKIKARLLVEKLEQFNVKGEIVGIKPGPAVTLFEFKPSIDVRLSKITDLENDLSLALSSESVRIIAPIPGRDVVGIETANSTRETVFLKDILQDEIFWEEKIKLPIILGRQANGEPKVVDLRTMPHLMVAGSTGSGKSVFTVAAVVGLLFRHSPKTLRIILIDPKQVDLAFFENIPHLLLPSIVEPKKAVSSLKWAVREMEKRYRSMKMFGARKLEEFNEQVSGLTPEEVANHQRTNEDYEENGVQKLQQYYYQELPFIVIVIEEFGDLMAVEKSNLEQQVVLLAQKARAAGIHLYLAMQSPRKDVVTGLIKTNIPGRVSFKVTNKMDSRIILDDSGAERLLAVGDMLYLSPGVAKPERHHGPYITNEEIAEVANFWSDQGEPVYDNVAMNSVENQFDDSGAGGEYDDQPESDDMYDTIVAEVGTMKEVSASLLQRRFKIGYPRAARLVEIMEREGVVGPANGSKPRQVLVNNLKSIS